MPTDILAIDEQLYRKIPSPRMWLLIVAFVSKGDTGTLVIMRPLISMTAINALQASLARM